MIIEHVENETVSFSKLAIGDVFTFGKENVDLNLKIDQNQFFDLTNNVLYTEKEYERCGLLRECVKIEAKLFWR